MKKEHIATGKTIDEAVDNACASLGTDRDNISIEVLDTPSKGFLGMGSTMAKIKVSYEAKESVSSTSAASDISYDKKDKSGAKEFLTELFTLMGAANAKISTKLSETELIVNVEGEGIGAIIGRRGETLDALQYILSLYLNRNKEGYIRIFLDIENYRKKRQETLERLAKRLAESAVKKKGTVTLEPMQPYERRIIHSVLQDFKDVTTYSLGIDPYRKVIIAYSPDGQKPTEQE